MAQSFCTLGHFKEPNLVITLDTFHGGESLSIVNTFSVTDRQNAKLLTGLSHLYFYPTGFVPICMLAAGQKGQLHFGQVIQNILINILIRISCISV